MSKETVCSRPYFFGIGYLTPEIILLPRNPNALTQRGSQIEGIRSTIHALTEENPNMSVEKREEFKKDLYERCVKFGIDIQILPEFMSRYEEIIGCDSRIADVLDKLELTTVTVLVK